MNYRSICLVLIVSLAMGISAQDSLDLGDIFIYGESELLPDYFRIGKNVDNYWSIYDTEKFDYIPKVTLYSPDKIEAAQEDTGNFSAMIGLGLPFYGIGKLAFQSLDRPWLNLNLSYYHDQPSAKWRTNIYKAYWQNKISGHRISLYLNGGLFTVKDPPLETDLKDIGVIYQTPEIELSDDLSIEKIRLKGSLLSVFQDSEGFWDDITSEEIHYEVNTGWQADRLSGELDFLYGSYGHAGAVSANTTLPPYLDEFGVWLAADEDDFYASVNLYKEIQFANRMQLRIENRPLLVEGNRIQDFKENQLQWIDEDYRIGKAPLNSTVALLYNSIVPLTLSYNVRWEKDKGYLIRDALYTDNTDNIYYQVYYKNFTDLLKQTVSLQAAYSWHNIFLEIGIAHHIYDEEIPFLPENKINTSITYEKGSLKTVWEANYIAGRINDKYLQQDRDMDDALLFDLYGSYALGERVSVFAEIQNLLDEDYKRYVGHNFPREKRRFILGGQYRF